MKIITDKINAAIEKAGGITQLADVLSVSRQAVYNWLNGVAIPRADVFFKIEAYLNDTEN